MYNIDKVCEYITYFLHEEVSRHVKKKTELLKIKERLREEVTAKIAALYDELDERIGKIDEEIYEADEKIDAINEMIEDYEECENDGEIADEKLIRELEEEIKNIDMIYI